MFVLTLPKTVKVGDTVDCRINAKPARVTAWGLPSIIEPGDRRRIVSMHDTGENLRTFICGDADGTADFNIISPDLDEPEGAAAWMGDHPAPSGPHYNHNNSIGWPANRGSLQRPPRAQPIPVAQWRSYCAALQYHISIATRAVLAPDGEQRLQMLHVRFAEVNDILPSLAS